VSATFHDNRTYDIEIVTDAAALAEKLAASGGDLRSRLKIVFDTGEARPQLAYSAVPGALATIHLTGQIPANARQFTWTYGWTFASYALTLRNHASGSSRTEWLEGGQASAPFPLTSAQPPASRPATAW